MNLTVTVKHLLFGTESNFKIFYVAILMVIFLNTQPESNRLSAMYMLVHHVLSSTFRIKTAISFLESGFNANSFMPRDLAFSSVITVE